MSAIFGEVLNFGEPNREQPIPLRVFGDEHYARYETTSGYSVIFDADLRRYCYAALSAGRFRSTGVTADQPPPAGLARHLQEERKVIDARASSRRIRREAIARNPRARDVLRTFGPNNGLLEGRVLAQGKVKGLTILVNFQDVKSTTTRADVDAMLNGANYTRNGNVCSANEYFKRVSSGKLDYTNVVVGPYTLSRSRQFYVDNLLVEEALQLAVAAGLDLKQFDSKNEGIVDALNVLYAGQTQYAGELWPHNYSIDLVFGAMRTDLYLLTSLGRTPDDLSIGTFCHENGHLLCRFPDMYDYGSRDGDSRDSAGIGMYCLMGAGNHLDFGRSPAPVCSYLRDLVGWCDNEIVLNNPGSFEARHGAYDTVLKYKLASKPNEYFIVENRSRMELDRAGTASGLAIYHCDTRGSNELQDGSATRHYQCAVLQADGLLDLENNANQGDGSDLFDTTPGIALSAATTPSSREWDGRDSGLVLSAIGAPGEVIAFKSGQPAVGGVQKGRAEPDLAIPDNRVGGVSSSIPITGTGTVSRIVVKVDIRHPYRGDLRVVLVSPTGKRSVLHAQLGGSRDNLIATYDSASPGVLTGMLGQTITGAWRLNVSDRAPEDVGRLKSWELELHPA